MTDSLHVCSEEESFSLDFETTGPIRPRKVNAVLESKNFQTPRPNVLIDNVKPKQVLQGKIRPQEAKISNLEPKSFQAKSVVQKTKILNNETNHQALKIAVKQELKRLAQNSPVGTHKLAIQKKKLLTGLKNKASIPLANVEETPSPPKVKKVMKVSNMQIQKTIPQKKTSPTQKTKLQENMIPAQKIKPQEKIIVPEKTKPENDISAQKNITPEKETCIPIIKTKNNSIPVLDTKSQENTPNTKPVPEVAQEINPAAQEKKAQETQKDAKVISASTSISAEKQQIDQVKTDVSSNEKFELDPILARAVEEQLQDIMIQVWQELPDDPLEEGDRLAVDKLRNEAGDDLRRVLGLNVTKRLLNVYNNLFVKMQFTCRPQMGCLTNFLNEHHINKFKRIDKNSNTFAAQMETIEDFDKLCAVKEVICGEAKVSVTPCYKFTQCPKKLKTIYDDTYFYEDTVQEHTKTLKCKKNIQKTVKTSKEIVTKPAKKAGGIVVKPTHKPVRLETRKTVNSVCNDSEDVKKESVTVDKKTTTDSSKQMPKDIVLKEKDVTDNVIDAKEVNNDTAKDKDESEYILKDKLGSDNDFDSGIPECQMEGDDELNDEDILALMSEGVVLDECSGSEDEN